MSFFARSVFVIGVIALAVIGLGWYDLIQHGKGLYEIIAVIGSVASTAGILVAILQVRHLSTISEATRRVAEDTRQAIRQNRTLSTLPRLRRLIDEIQKQLRLSDFEAALSNLKVLRQQLTELSGLAIMEERSLNRFPRLLKDIRVEINALSGHLGSSQRRKYNPTRLLSKLEEMQGNLDHLSTELTYTDDPTS